MNKKDVDGTAAAFIFRMDRHALIHTEANPVQDLINEKRDKEGDRDGD